MPASRYNFLPVGVGQSPGTWPGSAQGVHSPAEVGGEGQLDTDFGAFDATSGLYINPRTRRPWTGKLSNGQYAAGGKITADPSTAAAQAAANDVSQRYKAVDVIKSPDIAAGTADLMKQFKTGADQALKGFDDYVRQFKTESSAALQRQRQATDITPVTTNLANAQNRYATSLGQDSTDYAALNARTAAGETGLVTRANDMLSDYDTALQRAEDLAQQQVTGTVSRYAAGKNAGAGAPLGMGTDVAAIAAQKSYEASLPYEQAKIAKRYDILQNLDLPVQRDIANRETARISQFNPAISASIYGSNQDTQLKIQSLKEAAANRDWQTAIQILQVPQIAAQVRQQILAGDTSLLGLLSQLEESSHYRGLQDTMGVQVSQPQYFSPGIPGYPSPSPSRYNINPNIAAPVPPGLTAPRAPLQVGGQPGGRQMTAADYYYYRQTGQWPWSDQNFSQESYDDIVKNLTPRPAAVPGPQTQAGWNAGRYNFYVPDAAYQGDVMSNPALEGMV